AKTTTNLWGERWAKLCQNGMKNGVSAATGLTGTDCDRNDAIRRFSIQLGGEAVRVGQALGYDIVKIGKMEPETLAKASEGDKAALDEIESILRPGSNVNPNPRADIQRPSMAQDIRKGRRTEIEFMNGYIAERGNFIGVQAPTHAKLTENVKKAERQEVKAAPALLGAWRPSVEIEVVGVRSVPGVAPVEVVHGGDGIVGLRVIVVVHLVDPRIDHLLGRLGDVGLVGGLAADIEAATHVPVGIDPDLLALERGQRQAMRRQLLERGGLGRRVERQHLEARFGQ